MLFKLQENPFKFVWSSKIITLMFTLSQGSWGKVCECSQRGMQTGSQGGLQAGAQAGLHTRLCLSGLPPTSLCRTPLNLNYTKILFIILAEKELNLINIVILHHNLFKYTYWFIFLTNKTIILILFLLFLLD